MPQNIPLVLKYFYGSNSSFWTLCMTIQLTINFVYQHICARAYFMYASNSLNNKFKIILKARYWNGFNKQLSAHKKPPDTN